MAIILISRHMYEMISTSGIITFLGTCKSSNWLQDNIPVYPLADGVYFDEKWDLLVLVNIRKLYAIW